MFLPKFRIFWELSPQVSILFAALYARIKILEEKGQTSNIDICMAKVIQ